MMHVSGMVIRSIAVAGAVQGAFYIICCWQCRDGSDKNAGMTVKETLWTNA
jgi:hypothetical protein